MITLERTFDYAQVAAIMRHRRLYRWLGDDFYPPAEWFWPMENEQICYLLAREGGALLGVCITHPINPLLWEVHHALLPEAWGPRALEIGRAFEAWLWAHTRAERAFGLTPTDNRLALAYARRLGMQEAGRLARCYQRDGQLHDLIIFSKSRPKET